MPFLRNEFTKDNLSKKGGYIISKAHKKAEATIIATGSEVGIAVEAQAKLKEKDIAADVVSIPCTSLFDKNDTKYKKSILPEDTVKVAIEAASSFGWDKYLGEEGSFIGMRDFGASAPAPDLYKHFGITSDEVVKHVVQKLKKETLWQ